MKDDPAARRKVRREPLSAGRAGQPESVFTCEVSV